MRKLFKAIAPVISIVSLVICLVGSTTIDSSASNFPVSILSKKAIVEIYNPTEGNATITIDGTTYKVRPKKYARKTINLNGDKSKKISYSFTNGNYYKNSKIDYKKVSASGYIKRGNNYSIKPKTAQTTVDAGGWGINGFKIATYVKGF